jgi:hypothetical protein
MTLKQALAILKSNHDITARSFMFMLHERDTFDQDTFWDLYNATLIVGATEPAARGEDLRRDALWTYRNILMSIIWHFDPNDGARIKRLPKKLKLGAYLDRVEWGFHPLINATSGYGWDQTFGDGLTNPKQDVLTRYFGRRMRR